jgi:hypothetical protein
MFALRTMIVLACVGLIACGNAGSDGAGDGSTAPAGCCPPDPTLSGCMHLGGYSDGACGQTCDFWFSTNWRLESDSHGCPIWRWDTRAPQANESPTCQPTLDGDLTDAAVTNAARF